MTSQDFVRKWSDSRVKESAGAQSHFNDLCALLGEKTPIEADLQMARTGANLRMEWLQDITRRGTSPPAGHHPHADPIIAAQ